MHRWINLISWIYNFVLSIIKVSNYDGWLILNLKWTANFVKIVTEDMATDDNPHIVQSPWAWLVRTAAWVRRDLLKMLPHTNSKRKNA